MAEGGKEGMSEQIKLWSGDDDFARCTQKEKEKILKYQKDRFDSGKADCPYSRLPKGKKLMCKIFGNRCTWDGDYVFCPTFEEWFTEAEQTCLESLSPVGGG
jgi:hypothetical protein